MNSSSYMYGIGVVLLTEALLIIQNPESSIEFGFNQMHY